MVVGLPVDELGRLEPKGDLLVGGVNGVRSMDHVSAHVDGEVTSDGARLGGKWVGLS